MEDLSSNQMEALRQQSLAEARKKAESYGKDLDKGIEQLKKMGAYNKDWGAVKKLRHQIQKKHKDVQKSLDALSVDIKILNELLKEAFYSAPKVDITNYLASPVSPNFVWVYMKNHLAKNGFTQIGYVTDAHLKPDFSDAINEAMRWLLKLEKKVQGPEAIEGELDGTTNTDS